MEEGNIKRRWNFSQTPALVPPPTTYPRARSRLPISFLIFHIWMFLSVSSSAEVDIVAAREPRQVRALNNKRQPSDGTEQNGKDKTHSDHAPSCATHSLSIHFMYSYNTFCVLRAFSASSHFLSRLPLPVFHSGTEESCRAQISSGNAQ